jgi:PPOX class probable F420-dependent enzyme
VVSGLTVAVRDFLEQADVGVLGVKRQDGSVHQSVVYHVLEGDTLLISTEPTRLKGRAVKRDGWASYCVVGPERPHAAVSVEGPARLLDDGVAEPTMRLFAKIFGRDPDPLTDEQVRSMNRTIIELTIERVYASSYLS